MVRHKTAALASMSLVPLPLRPLVLIAGSIGALGLQLEGPTAPKAALPAQPRVSLDDLSGSSAWATAGDGNGTRAAGGGNATAAMEPSKPPAHDRSAAPPAPLVPPAAVAAAQSAVTQAQANSADQPATYPKLAQPGPEMNALSELTERYNQAVELINDTSDSIKVLARRRQEEFDALLEAVSAEERNRQSMEQELQRVAAAEERESLVSELGMVAHAAFDQGGVLRTVVEQQSRSPILLNKTLNALQFLQAFDTLLAEAQNATVVAQQRLREQQALVDVSFAEVERCESAVSQTTTAIQMELRGSATTNGLSLLQVNNSLEGFFAAALEASRSQTS